METEVARSIFQEASPLAGLRVCAFRGWQEDSSVERPVGGVKVAIIGPKPSGTSTWASTTTGGAALFFLDITKQVKYDVNIEAPGTMMVLPDTENFEVTVNKDSWTKERIYVEYPCWLSVRLLDAKSGEPINIQPGEYGSEDSHLILTSRFSPVGEKKAFSSSTISESDIGPLWPLGSKSVGEVGAYGLDVKNVPGYHDASWVAQGSRFEKDNGEVWDGTFPQPNFHLSLTTRLIPIPSTPADAVPAMGSDLDWLKSQRNSYYINSNSGNQVAEDEEKNLLAVSWDVDNPNATIDNKTEGSLMARSMYWQNKLDVQANLNLSADLIVFNEWVKVDKSNTNLILNIPPGLGIEGNKIGGIPGIQYGELHLVEGIFRGEPSNNDNLMVKGAYYFPDGFVFSQNMDYSSLIPWHKLD